jgi:hypothetical protein
MYGQTSKLLFLKNSTADYAFALVISSKCFYERGKKCWEARAAVHVEI